MVRYRALLALARLWLAACWLVAASASAPALASVVTVYDFEPFSDAQDLSTSLFARNDVSSGGTSNEYIELAAAGIRHVAFAAGPAASSFVLDDLTVERAEAAPLPLSATVWLAVMGLVLMPAARRHTARRG